MVLLRRTVLLVVAALTCLAAGSETSQSWSFGSQDAWTGTCGLGVRQSPVDINFLDGSVVHDKSLAPLEYKGFANVNAGKLSVTNNGKNIAIAVSDTDAPMSIKTDKDTTYKIAQLNFHWGLNNLYGSEHSINGKYFPLELHFVGYKGANLTSAVGSKDSNAMAQFAVFFALGDHNPVVQAILDAAKGLTPGKRASVPFSLNIASLLPARAAQEYLTYVGSLSAPPCTENVQWFVSRNVLALSPIQLEQFRAFINADGQVMSNTFRGVQRLNGRKISSSFSFVTRRMPPAAAWALASTASTPAVSTPYGPLATSPVVVPVNSVGPTPAPVAVSSITDVDSDYAVRQQLTQLPYGTVMNPNGPTVFPVVRPPAALSSLRAAALQAAAAAGATPGCAECVGVHPLDVAFPVRTVVHKSLIETSSEAEAETEVDAEAEAEADAEAEVEIKLTQEELSEAFAQAQVEVDAEEEADVDADADADSEAEAEAEAEGASFIETGASEVNATKVNPPTGDLTPKPAVAHRPAHVIDGVAAPEKPKSRRAVKLERARISAARNNAFSTNELDFSDPHAAPKPETDPRYAASPLGFVKQYRGEPYGPETPVQVSNEAHYARMAGPRSPGLVTSFSRDGMVDATFRDEVPSNKPVMPETNPEYYYNIRGPNPRYYAGQGAANAAAAGPFHPLAAHFYGPGAGAQFQMSHPELQGYRGYLNNYNPEVYDMSPAPRPPRFPMSPFSRRVVTATMPDVRAPYARPTGDLKVTADHSSYLPSHMTPTKHYAPLSPRNTQGIDWVHGLPPKDTFTSPSLVDSAMVIDGAFAGSAHARAAQELSAQHAALLAAEQRFSLAEAGAEATATVDAEAEIGVASGMTVEAQTEAEISPENVQAAYAQFEHYLNAFEPRVAMLTQYKTRRQQIPSMRFGQGVRSASALNTHAATLEAVRETKMVRQLKQILDKFRELKKLHGRVSAMRERFANNPAVKLQLDVTRNNLQSRMDALLETTENMKTLSKAEKEVKSARTKRARAEENVQRKLAVFDDIEKVAKDLAQVETSRYAETARIAKLQLLRAQLAGTDRLMRPDAIADSAAVTVASVKPNTAAPAAPAAAAPAAAAPAAAAPAAAPAAAAPAAAAPAAPAAAPAAAAPVAAANATGHSFIEADVVDTLGVSVEGELAAFGSELPAAEPAVPAASAEAKPLDVPMTLNSLLDDLQSKATSLAEQGASATESSSVAEALDNLEALQAVQAKVERVQEDKIARLRLAKNRQAVAVEEAKLAEVRRKHVAAQNKERAAVARLQSLAEEANAQKAALVQLKDEQSQLRSNLASLLQAQEQVEAQLAAASNTAADKTRAEAEFVAQQERARAEIEQQRVSLMEQRATVERERAALEARAQVVLSKAQQMHVLASQLKLSHQIRVKKAHRRAAVESGSFVDLSAEAEAEAEAKTNAKAEADIEAEYDLSADSEVEAEAETEVAAEQGITDADIEALLHAAD